VSVRRRSLEDCERWKGAVKLDLWGLCPQTPRIYRLAAKIGLDWGSELDSLPTNLGPGVGAQVASLRCPILRPGHRRV
jgi:hypothetical protein